MGDRVPATVTARVPAKFFVKNAQVTVTPYLCFDGQEVASQAYSFQGEKVRGNAPVISYDNGGTVTIPVMYAYQPEMMRSELELAFDVRQGNKQYVLPRVKVADGVVATAALADASTVTPALAPDKFQRIINESITPISTSSSIRPTSATASLSPTRCSPSISRSRMPAATPKGNRGDKHRLVCLARRFARHQHPSGREPREEYSGLP